MSASTFTVMLNETYFCRVSYTTFPPYFEMPDEKENNFFLQFQILFILILKKKFCCIK